MNEYENLFIQQLSLAAYGCTLEQIDKAALLEKYELLAGVLTKESQPIVIDNNLANFGILFNKTLFLSLLYTTHRPDLMDYKNLNKLLTVMDNKFPDKKPTERIELLYNEIEKALQAHGGSAAECQSIESVTQALQTFGMAETELTDEEAAILDDDDLGDIEIDENELFDNDDDIDIETENTDDINIDEDGETEETETEKEKKAEISNIFSALIEQNVNTLTKVLMGLYESGFSAIPQAGILVNNGANSPLIRLRESIKAGNLDSMQANADAGTAFDFMIMQVICDKLKSLSTYNTPASGNAIPDISEIMDKSMVCPALHLQFQSANIEYCTGITSIRKWITAEKVNGKDSKYTSSEDYIKANTRNNKLTNIKDIKSWYRWCLKNIMVESLIKANVKSLADMDTAIQVLSALTKNIKNVIVVSDRAVGEQEEIKISTDDVINVDDIIQSLTNKLNIGNTNSIEIKQIAKESFEANNILTLSITFDKEKANNSDKFAHEIINRLADAGSLPSWDNALLGKKEDGTYLFWKDFMGSAEPYKRCYTIYAGSRSGKGVMTSTLIASALCDSKHVFYTDGKPENGACLGKISWDEGKEAYAFDGQAKGKAPFVGFMENYAVDLNGNPVRTPEEVVQFMDSEHMPECLFANSSYFNNNTQKIFLGVMRYLKSIQLCASIINKRAAGELPSSDWQVWIFDEMKDMSEREKEVREIFAKYMRSKSGAKEPGSDDPKYYYIDTKSFKNIEEARKNDPGVDYICKWVKWTSHIRRLMETANVISLGKAQANLIFIFQEATWIPEANKITTIGKIVNALKSTKIVGANALAKACGDYGDAHTINTDWYKKVNQGTGWWAISKGADVRSSQVILFKPFKVWTIPIIKGENDKLDPNGDRNDQKYIGGYARALLAKAGLNPADILQEAYDYANDAVVSSGYAGSLKEFIYNPSNFISDGIDASYEGLHSDYEDNDFDNSQGLDPTQMNIADDEDILDFGSTSTDTRMSNEELLTTAEYIWSQCETDALGPEQKNVFIKMIVALLREWGW